MELSMSDMIQLPRRVKPRWVESSRVESSRVESRRGWVDRFNVVDGKTSVLDSTDSSSAAIAISGLPLACRCTRLPSAKRAHNQRETYRVSGEVWYKRRFLVERKNKNNHHFYQFVKYCNLKISLDDIIYHIMLRYKTPTVAVLVFADLSKWQNAANTLILYISREFAIITLWDHMLIHK